MSLQLTRKIKEEIESSPQRAISLARFMELALSDEEYGYYVRKNPLGRAGDFITSPEITQIFGEIIALYFIDRIQSHPRFSEIEQINLIELGAGTGLLAYDIMKCFAKIPDIYAKTSLSIIEINQELLKKQRQTLDFCRKKLKFFSDIKELRKKYLQGNTAKNPKNFTIIYNNEFFDSLPIEQFVYERGKSNNKGELLQRMITINNKDELIFVDFATEFAADFLAKNPDKFTDESLKKAGVTNTNKNKIIYEYQNVANAIFCSCLDIIADNNNIASLIFAADYAYLYPLYKDSLQSIYKHKYNNILDNIGCADITSYVNFGEFCLLSAARGHDKITYATQGDFMRGLGIELLAHKHKIQNPYKAQDIDSSIARLCDKDKMGEIFKIFILEC